MGRAAEEVAADRAAVSKALNRITVKIDRYVTAIGESDEPVKPMVDRLNKMEAERVALAEKVRLIEAEGNVVSLHPAAINKFATSIEAIHKAMTSDESKENSRCLLGVPKRVRSILGSSDESPAALCGNTLRSALGHHGGELFPEVRSPEEMLAEQGHATMPLAATERIPT